MTQADLLTKSKIRPCLARSILGPSREKATVFTLTYKWTSGESLGPKSGVVGAQRPPESRRVSVEKKNSWGGQVCITAIGSREHTPVADARSIIYPEGGKTLEESPCRTPWLDLPSHRAASPQREPTWRSSPCFSPSGLRSQNRAVGARTGPLVLRAVRYVAGVPPGVTHSPAQQVSGDDS